MKFSLVLATVYRVEELRRFLTHLKDQTYTDFELIIVDQNSDDRLVALISDFICFFLIIHIRSPSNGLSCARNIGLKHTSGNIIAFPDDDCWYPVNLLANVKDQLSNNNVDGITGRSVDHRGTQSAARWMSKVTLLNVYNVWTGGISITVFLKIKQGHNLISFDETLGVGANTPWGSGEETDLLIYLIKDGWNITYDPSIIVYHPNPIINYDDKAIARAKAYGGGMGRVLKKHKLSFTFVFYSWFRPFVGAVSSLLILKTKKSRYHWSVLMGRVKGWFS